MSRIEMKIGTNTKRTTVIVDSSLSPKQVLTEQEIDFSRATVHLDGSVLSAQEMNTSLDKLGVSDSSYLIAVTKMDNAI
jgi:hypothetical protein